MTETETKITTVDIATVRALAEREENAVDRNGWNGRSGAVLDLTQQILEAAEWAEAMAVGYLTEVPVLSRLLDEWHAAMAAHCVRRAAELAASWQCSPSDLVEDHPVTEHLRQLRRGRPSETMGDLAVRLQSKAWPTWLPLGDSIEYKDDGVAMRFQRQVGSRPYRGVEVHAWISHHDIGDGIGPDFSEVVVPLFDDEAHGETA